VGPDQRRAVIRTPDRRFGVFVSSTLGELAEERRAVARAVSALRLSPVMFELGDRPYPPREVYQQYLAQSDVFIGLYWQRYGQLAPGARVSGLEEEFELSAELPRLVPDEGDPATLGAGDVALRLIRRWVAAWRTSRLGLLPACGCWVTRPRRRYGEVSQCLQDPGIGGEQQAGTSRSPVQPWADPSPRGLTAEE
jgi:hypothetical protein